METNTLSAMWATRPVRIPKKQGGQAKIAGVCEGIGVRYQIDPTLVRVAFVVTTLAFGGGVAAYFLAWMCMPLYGKSSAPIQDLFGRRDGAKNESGLAITLIIGFLIFFGNGQAYGDMFTGTSGSSLVAIVLLVLCWYLLHQRLPMPPAGLIARPATTPADGSASADDVPTTAAASATASTTATGPDMSAFTPVDGYPFPPGRETPPDWDPLGTAPDLWHLGNLDTTGASGSPHAAQAAPKSTRVWPWLLLAGACTAIGIVGSVLATGPDNTSGDEGSGNSADTGIGGASFRPTTAAELLDEYDVGIGTLNLDVSQLNQLDEPRSVTVNVDIGQLDLTPPTELPYNLNCDTGIGSSNCQPHTDPNAKLTINIDNGIGRTTVH